MARPLVRVDGAQRLLRTTIAAAGRLDDLKAAHHATGQLVLVAASARAPRDSGALAGSGRAGRGATRVVIRYGNNRAVRYAGPQHWGWPARKIRATFFATDAARATEEQWVRFFVSEVDKILGSIQGV